MRIFEVDDSASATTSSNDLMGLADFLAGRISDTDANRDMSQAAFISLAQSLGINVNQSNLGDLIAKPPLSNILEPLDPNSGVITFKGGAPIDTAMPVNRAQDIVAAAAKSAMKKKRVG
jgi:hypothetical protein